MFLFQILYTPPLPEAEHYYVEAKLWTSAMSMYRQLEKWEDPRAGAVAAGVRNKRRRSNRIFEIDP